MVGTIDGLTPLQRGLKRRKEKAKSESGYKKIQRECDKEMFERNHFPKTFWESSKGTYINPKRKEKKEKRK